jgi:caa(3)-type oxidase subunit IV
VGAHGENHSPKHYIKIWAVLCVLLVLSVLGPMAEIFWLTMITAFGIAFVKAFLVIKHFMHLGDERPIVHYMLITAIVFIMMFFAAVSPDVLNHEGSRWENMASKEVVRKGLAAQKDGHGAHEGGGDGHGSGGGDHGHGH